MWCQGWRGLRSRSCWPRRRMMGRGRRAARGWVLASGGLALVALALLARWDVVAVLAVVAIAILLARAAWGVSPWRRPARAQKIGVLELGFGLLTALLA